MTRVQRRPKSLLLAAALAVTVALLTPVRASFDIGTASNYGVLIESGAHSFQLNNSAVNGNVGIGANLGGGGVQIASNGFINDAIAGDNTTGQLQLVDSSANVSNPGNVQGGVFFNQSQVTTLLTTVNSLGSMLGGEAGTALTINGGGQVVNASAGLLDAGGNHVFTVGANGFNNDHGGFTINGSASDYVVVNINNGTTNEALNGGISLSGGITSDHVLFNFTGTGGELHGAANGATVNGIFLAPNMKFNTDSVTVDGRFFGGAAGQDFQLVSGFNLNAPPPSVPEPSSLALLGIGGGLFGLAQLWRRRGRRTV